MKISFTLLILLIWNLTLFAQNPEVDKEGFIEIKELSAKIKTKGKGISYKKAAFKLYNEYNYQGGIVFGSWIRLVVSGIEEVNNFGGQTFILTKTKFTRLDDKKVMFETPWSTDDDDDEPVMQSGENNLIQKDKIKIGRPWYSGKYLWEVAFGDICANNEVVVSVEFEIVPNPCITVETSGDAAIKEAYLWNKEKKFIYANDKVFPGVLNFSNAEISGFTIKENLMKIGVALKVTDDAGNLLAQADDMAEGSAAFEEVSEDGTISLSPNYDIGTKLIGRTLTFESRIWDKHDPKNEVKTVAKFIVKK